MPPDLYLIAPPDIGTAALLERLRTALDRPGVAALLLTRGRRNEADYRDLVRTIAPVVQELNIAALIEGEPDWVRDLGADGLHVTGTIADVRDAVSALKPDLIVGVGDIRSRHDAMQKAEAGVDYILFGPLSGRIDDTQREFARWWAETMEIPSVLSDPEASTIAAEGCEFVGVGVLALEHIA